MPLLVLNGSPRGNSSNSTMITSWFLESYLESNFESNSEITTRYLNKVKHHSEYALEAVAAEKLLMVFPLYVDGMPAQVKSFIETLYPYKAQLAGKPITFIIHSGFSEGIQNKSLETYLNRFANIMGLTNAGVIVIPGSEGFRIMPPNMTKKKHILVAQLGQQFNNNTPYDQAALQALRGRETTSKFGKIVFEVLAKLGLTNFYWNSLLKKNGAFEKRFDAPYR